MAVISLTNTKKYAFLISTTHKYCKNYFEWASCLSISFDNEKVSKTLTITTITSIASSCREGTKIVFKIFAATKISRDINSPRSNRDTTSSIRKRGFPSLLLRLEIATLRRLMRVITIILRIIIVIIVSNVYTTLPISPSRKALPKSTLVSAKDVYYS